MSDDRGSTHGPALKLAIPTVADVLVVGGGTGGTTAALAAAELGARVVVVDRDSGLGGVGTRAGIHFYYWGQQGGLQDALDKQTRMATQKGWGEVRGFHPLAKQVTVETRLSELGVQVLTESVVARVLMDGDEVAGAVVDHPEGRFSIAASVVVDATGNGDVAALAGAEFWVGRAWDQVMNPYSFVPRFVDPSGRLSFANFDCGWLDSTDPDDLSRCLREGRRIGWQRFGTLPDHTLLALGPQLGIREGRRIVGREVVTQPEILEQRERADVVFRCRTHLDFHAQDYANESDLAQIWIPLLGWRKRGLRGDVPFGALLPRGIDGLIMGCRALSGDQDVAAGVRMQRDMHRLGEVAGVAAGLAVTLGVLPHDVPREVLQRQLRDRGILEDLPDSSVSEGPQSPTEALALLGGDRESDALWWAWRNPAEATPALLTELGNADRLRRRGAALALGLLRHPEGLDALVDIVAECDGDLPGNAKIDQSAPRWIAALLLLRLARHPGAVELVIDQLAESAESVPTLYRLHYLRDLAPLLDPDQRRRARAATEALLDTPELGQGYVLHSSDRFGLRDIGASIDWSLELTASALLELLNVEVDGIRDRWRRSAFGPGRRFARRLDRGEAGSLTPESQRPLERRAFDAVVAGGGIAGVAAALEVARTGAKVLLVEPGPVLGHEITASRRTLLGEGELPEGQGGLLGELVELGCLREGVLDVTAVAVALDELCRAADVAVLLHGVPGELRTGLGPSGIQVTGLAVTTIAGALEVVSPVVVDATTSGRLVGPFAARARRETRTGIDLVLRQVPAGSERTWRPGGAVGVVAVLASLGTSGYARLRVVADVAEVPAAGVVAFATEVFNDLAAAGPLRDSVLCMAADAPLAPVFGRRRLADLDLPAGLVGAGPWQDDAPDVLASDRAYVEHQIAAGRDVMAMMDRPSGPAPLAE